MKKTVKVAKPRVSPTPAPSVASSPTAGPDSFVVPDGPVEGAVAVERKIEHRLQETIDELKSYKTMVNGMCNEFIDRLTDAKREIKMLRREQKKPRPVNITGPKKPSTFEVPTNISDELCLFLGVVSGTQMSRNDVTHAIHRYCKQKGLLLDTDQRQINPDEALRGVLSPIEEGERLTFFNLQRYLKHNYL